LPVVIAFAFPFVGGLSTVENRVETALYKCEVWMQKSLNCVPPQRKIFKYQWRLKKNLRDGLWHLNGRKTCEENESLEGTGLTKTR